MKTIVIVIIIMAIIIVAIVFLNCKVSCSKLQSYKNTVGTSTTPQGLCPSDYPMQVCGFNGCSCCQEMNPGVCINYPSPPPICSPYSSRYQCGDGEYCVGIETPSDCNKMGLYLGEGGFIYGGNQIGWYYNEKDPSKCANKQTCSAIALQCIGNTGNPPLQGLKKISPSICSQKFVAKKDYFHFNLSS
jgi:hypothetical protein